MKLPETFPPFFGLRELTFSLVGPSLGKCPLGIRNIQTLLTAFRFVITLGPSGFDAPLLWPQLTLGHSLFVALGCRLADRASRGKTRFFRRTTSGFTASVLRLPFGLRFHMQPYSPFSLISGFCS